MNGLLCPECAREPLPLTLRLSRGLLPCTGLPPLLPPPLLFKPDATWLNKRLPDLALLWSFGLLSNTCGDTFADDSMAFGLGKPVCLLLVSRTSSSSSPKSYSLSSRKLNLWKRVRHANFETESKIRTSQWQIADSTHMVSTNTYVPRTKRVVKNALHLLLSAALKGVYFPLICFWGNCMLLKR